ncbi:MAG: alpha/beta hydrolase, partial [Acidimicrobiia bacterium]
MQKLRYYREKFSMARRFIVRHTYFETRSADGVRIAGAHLMARGSGGPDSRDYGYAFVVVHGLFSNHRAHGMLEFAESLTRFGPVWTIDLRGHGFSGGECTLGNLEAHDVAGVTRGIREITDLPIVLVGFSMGGAAVIRSAALLEPVSAVVAISPPAKWGGQRRWAATRTRAAWRVPGGRMVLRLMTGVRLARRVQRHESPRSVVGKISPAPLLIVYGDSDHFFPQIEAEMLLNEASEPKELWMIEGGDHAEGLFYDAGERVDLK